MLSALTWFIIGLALMGLEVLAPGFVLFWFGLGALLTSGLMAIGVLSSEVAEWIFFLVSSLAFLLAWQFWFKKFFRRDVLEEDRDATVSGQVGVVSKAIGVDSPGEVELSVYLYGLKRWAAVAEENIPEGAKVRVVEARGVRLLVKRVEWRDNQA
ncbi:MAG: NfeD family protein [Spirochaetota bacterium]|nr:NfeD family protein [Spirochaetota bacterium]